MSLKTKEKVEETSNTLELTLGTSAWNKLQAALAGKTKASVSTMPTMPLMPMVPVIMVVPVIFGFTMYPFQMYQNALVPQDEPGVIEIECIDAQGKVVKVKMVKDSSIT